MSKPYFRRLYRSTRPDLRNRTFDLSLLCYGVTQPKGLLCKEPRRFPFSTARRRTSSSGRSGAVPIWASCRPDPKERLMTHEQFEICIRYARKEIPEGFRDRLQNVDITIKDEPKAEMLESLSGLTPDWLLFGLH